MDGRVAIFLLLAPCFACHDDKPKADTSQAPSAEPIPSDLVYNAFVDDTKKTPTAVVEGDAAATSAETSASTVKLDDAGADPKAPIRYAFAGKTRTVDASITISGGAPGMADQPPLHFVFTATPKPKNMLGHDATIDVTITKFDITLPPNMPPQQAAGKDQLEKALVGVKGHFDVTTFGDVGDAAFDSDQLPRGAGDIVGVVQQTFELLVVPVPGEPVGIGAKWEKSENKRLGDQGTSVSAKTTVTLVARDAQTVTFKVENTASGTMSVSDPRAPKGTLIDRKSTASFDVVARLDGMAQKVDGATTTNVTQKVPGQPDQAVSLKMSEKLTSK
ncbi:MAG TPA: hypothetical protein VGH28_07360 [Polyangiaceae bacterium]|jgi:hypothetical protein